MITIANFSHPLGDMRQDIADILGLHDLSDYKVINIPVQLDLTKPLRCQVAPLVHWAAKATGNNIRNIDVIVPPGLALAAILIVDEFRTYGYLPRILHLSRDPNSMTPHFVATELIELHKEMQNE